MPTTRVLSRLCLVVAFAFAMSACAADPRGEMPPPDDEEVDLDSTTAPLMMSEGRTIEVESWKWDPTSKSYTSQTSSRVPATVQWGKNAQGILGRIMHACMTEILLRGYYPAGADPRCGRIRSPWSVFQENTVALTGVESAVNLSCAGHWALSLAEGTHPLYVGYGGDGENGSWWVNSTVGVPPSWQKHFDRKGIVSQPDNYHVAAKVPVPSPSDAATWALIAADLFREAAVVSARTLDPDQCAPADLNKVFKDDFAGTSYNIMEHTAGMLVDSLTSMVEAAERAQEAVAASGAAKHSTAADLQAGIIQEWRDRHDSRLEAASIFVPIDERVFETRQARPLYVATNDTNSYYTSVPEVTETGYRIYGDQMLMGFIYPPEFAAPAGTAALTTYRKPTGALPITTDEPASNGNVANGQVLRTEGWVPTTTTADHIVYKMYKAGTAEPFRYRWLLDGTTAPTGWTVTTDEIRVFPNNFDIPNTSDWKYPVVLATSDSQGTARALELLRTTRVDPRLSASRQLPALANDILYSFQNEYKGLYGNVASGEALLPTLKITTEELQRASQRLIQESNALGRVIVDDPANPGAAPTANAFGRPKLVWGTSTPSAATDPALIYARTGGRFVFPSYTALDPRSGHNDYVWAGTTPATPGQAYARSSILAALDYVRWIVTTPATDAFDTTRFNSRYTAPTLEMLRSSLSWSEQLLGPRVRVAMSTLAATPAGQVNAMELVLDGLGLTTAAEAKNQLDIWSSEAGLECALTNAVAGRPCDPSTYRFLETGTWTIGAATDADLPKRGAIVIPLPKELSPQRSGANPIISTNTPLFVVRSVGSERKVITAFYPAQPVAAGTTNGVWLTPYSDYTAKVLSDGLAANPAEPTHGETSCSGLSSRVRVKLEDELTEASEGRDDIESSFAHYLRRARDAAQVADGLGEQLIAQGLEMDLRTEQARDELEKLCGGVINVERLRSYACTANNGCSLSKLLVNPGSISDVAVRGDAMGLMRCLGLTDPPVAAVLGDGMACVWSVKNNSTNQEHLPCTCPQGASVCAARRQCVFMTDGDSCPASINSGGYTLSYSPAFNLNMSASEADSGKSQEPDKFACGNLLALRSHMKTSSAKFKPNKQWEGFDWITQENLQNLGNAMAFRYDGYLFPSVTQGGSILTAPGSEKTGPATPGANGAPVAIGSPRDVMWQQWPCSRHPMLDPANAGYDAAAAFYCSLPGNKSLLCGGHCGPANSLVADDRKRSIEQVTKVGPRLRNAVDALKGISGASFRNSHLLRTEDVPSLRFSDGFVHTGTLPAWHPFAPGLSGARTPDGATSCAWFGDTSVICNTREYQQATYLDLTTTQGAGGWPQNPWFVWHKGATCRGTETQDSGAFRVHPDSCGSMPTFLSGKSKKVTAKMQGCPKIPDSRCVWTDRMERTCGEEIRRLDAWLYAPDLARRPIPSSVDTTLDCMRGIDELEYLFDESEAAALQWYLQIRLSTCPAPREEDAREAFETWAARELKAYNCRSSIADAGSVVNWDVMLDALDLACAARSTGKIGCETLLDESYVPSDATDFSTMSRMAECAADRIEGNLEQMVLVGVPQSVASDIAGQAIVDVFPTNRGEYGEVLASLAGEIVAMRRHGDSVVQAVRDLQLRLSKGGTELAVLGLEQDIQDVELMIENLDLTKLDVQSEIATIRSRQAISQSVTSCVAASARAAGNWVKSAALSNFGEITAAAATCAQSIVDINAEVKVRDLNESLLDIDGQKIEAAKQALALRGQITEQQRQILMFDLATSVNETLDRINEALISLQASHVSIQGYLAKLDGQRSDALRLASKVLMIGGDSVGRQYAVNSAMRARMNTTRARYDVARRDAIRASYLARRAVEQKLGVDMSLMTKSLEGAPSPSSWVDKLCTLSGIDYAAIRSAGVDSDVKAEVSTKVADKVPQDYSYAEGYIGDYVRQLEDFVEAYRITYPFKDADALAVVSLRDEILGVRRRNEECPAVQGPNLLYFSDGLAGSPSSENKWRFTCTDSGDIEGQGVVTTDLPEESPFVCPEEAYCTKPQVKVTSWFGATHLCRVDDEDAAETAASSLVYSVAAADCSGANLAGCTTGGALTVVGTPPTLTSGATGIAERTALTATNGQGVKIDGTFGTVPAFSVSAAVSLADAPANAANFVIWSSETRVGNDDGLVTLSLRVTSGGTKMVTLRQDRWPLVNGVRQTALVSTVEATLPYAAHVVGLRASGSEGRLELWVDGRRSNQVAATVVPSALNAKSAFAVPAGNNGKLRVGKLAVHDTWLTNAEMVASHSELGSAYGIPAPELRPVLAAIPQMQQDVVLDRGSYMLSWFQKPLYENVNTDRAIVEVSDAGVQIPVTYLEDPINSDDDLTLATAWVRHVAYFDVAEMGLITVGIGVEAEGTATMAGPQLEAMPPFSTVMPSPYFPTGATLDASVATCEDVGGEKFRTSKYWDYACEYHCPPGAGLDCASQGEVTGLPRTCFYETKFPISLEAIEKGDLLPQAGFARGNFNYRIQSLAVNVVGSGIKNCELSETPSSCYANSNILYSLRHDEPFRIRNYDGDVFRASLYPGNIQHAQALLAERYISNPISGADRGLLEDYWRQELEGRPLDGNFRLRIYETEGLDWRAVEDVQVVMKYRYWTRER